MKKFFFASAFSIFFLIGCMEIPQYVDGDAAVSADSSVSADGGGRGDVALPVSGTSCLNRCNDYNVKATCQCDDKCVDKGDCCGDFIKQCVIVEEAKPTADVIVVSQPKCVDSDGDGWCTTAPKAGDCNDSNKFINPDAAEKCGDNVDNNCNGQIDEGCAAAPAPATTSTASLTVKYPDSASRQLSYGVTTDKSSIPYVWTALGFKVSDTFTADLGAIQVPASKCLYIRFNVDEPGQKWLCNGNTTASAQLNTAATITLKVLDKTLTSAQTIVLGGGCSAIFVVPFDGATNCGL